MAEEPAGRWFALCDKDGTGKVLQLRTVKAQQKLAEAAGARKIFDESAIKPGAMTDRDTFVMSVLELAESSGKEVAVAAALEEMIADIEMYGLPPCESGDPVRDMEEYRRYHGLDRVFGFLLQSLIMHEPNDPVQHMQERVNELSEFVRLRRDIGDQPYHGHEAIKKSA
ncbi:hypothetical protein GUITHDRAFT_155594 [Guillardia theta CCMP2712]|uniref:Uncharacterized protein n=2 Tax=Guillardia theta TaxID=55529 RepID=L1IGI9_GUITC|nr:hypothetical protein GUITHDRAFT_155594 [Guillardia theta CCMP2712]EKX35044.1 hypothetical protein GUITHDRAFT_155594 [Guillardia theta CCMP2712]|eukprot:XP_005822024.1 hypothetical protein GUITHDRAFT_155594 [Guillardia theta CCMP2712]